MSRTSLALIGCGGMGQSHLSRFFSLADRLEVKSVVDVDIEALLFIFLTRVQNQ